MIELIILSVSVLLLIIAVILWRAHKKKKLVAGQPDINVGKQTLPETKTPPVVEKAETTAKVEEKVIVSEPVIQKTPEQPTLETVVPAATPAPQTMVSHLSTCCSSTTSCYKNVPEDSALRRHYLTHLRSMISSLHGPRPSDSALARHYESDIAAELERCLTDKQAMQRLLDHYQQSKLTVSACCSSATVATPASVTPEPQMAEPAVVVETPQAPKNEPSEKATCCCRLPEDSALRRHYLTQLYAEAAAKLPARPTDSTLRRHYDSLLENTVKQLLG